MEQNAPKGILDHILYPGFDEITYDWEIVYDDGDFKLYVFTEKEYGCCYCGSYKNNAFIFNTHYKTVEDAYFTAMDFFHQFFSQNSTNP